MVSLTEKSVSCTILIIWFSSIFQQLNISTRIAGVQRKDVGRRITYTLSSGLMNCDILSNFRGYEVPESSTEDLKKWNNDCDLDSLYMSQPGVFNATGYPVRRAR
jgi:hypothetical protein